jgi:phage shock protein A
MEDRVTEMEARTEAIEELRDDRTQLEKDFLDMEIHAEIDDELQKLKQKISNQTKT